MAVHDNDVTEETIREKREIARVMELELDYLIKLSTTRVPVEARPQALAADGAGGLEGAAREMSRLQRTDGSPGGTEGPARDQGRQRAPGVPNECGKAGPPAQADR